MAETEVVCFGLDVAASVSLVMNIEAIPFLLFVCAFGRNAIDHRAWRWFKDRHSEEALNRVQAGS